LDLLVSFADLIALSSDTFVRPKLTSSGGLTIHSGRHPVVSANRLQQLGQPFVPNDININEYQNFQVITGANGSGKVSFLRCSHSNFLVSNLFVSCSILSLVEYFVDSLSETSCYYHHFSSNRLLCSSTISLYSNS
jgi:DNA mismatch repair ATPase MutS